MIHIVPPAVKSFLLLLLSVVLLQPQQAYAAFKFEEVGLGDCLDSEGSCYDIVFFENGKANLDDCKAACLQCHNGGHQVLGLYYNPSSLFCTCFLEDGSTENNCGLDDSSHDFSLSGTGPVATALNWDGSGTCYRVVELMPSEAPSSSLMPSVSLMPTDVPSTSAAPSLSSMTTDEPSDSPSKSTSPSSNPSETPSVSSIPSSAPSQQPSLSENPTSQPSDCPSKSTSPSSNPSETPSVSSSPSSKPSLGPSQSLEPSASPSDSPSKSTSPSSNPSEAPSVSSMPSSAPSQQPSLSINPTSQPSSGPSQSIQPSASPSDKPSKSISPSEEPSFMPSTSAVPSVNPSDKPSTSSVPTSIPIDDPSTSSQPSPIPQIQVIIGSSMTIKTNEDDIMTTVFGTNADNNSDSGFITQDDFVQATAAQIKSQACPADSSDDFLDCQVIIDSVNGNNVSGEDGGDGEGESGRIRRSLQSTSDLVIAFEILIQAICSNSDCSDALTLGNQVYEQVTGDLQDALSNVNFLNELAGDFDASTNIATILSNTNLPPTVTFQDVIIPFTERYPSAMPSKSLEPSESPSDSPSETPSVTPSSTPSSDPSEFPSSQPSETPSTTPSLVPSSTPSCSPSASPTEKPSTVLYGVNLFYPEWMRGKEGCRSDGDEPTYMAADPTFWLTSTLEACCKKWFSGYNYNVCLGKYPTDSDDCVKLLHYPDWQGSNKGCLADGKEPLYMLNNYDYFLSNTKEECCEKFYPWDLTCGGTGKEQTMTNGKFYPDWSGSMTQTCLNDGKAPGYMLYNQNHYLSTTLDTCCKKHFSWNVKKCLGDSSESVSVGSNEWYVNWTDKKCVKDCKGASPCGGIANSWDELHTSQEICCEKKLYWVSKRECVTN